MNRTKLATLTAAGLTLGICTGCPFVDSRTTNQGGGTVITAVDKVATQELASLTPDELQILTDTFSSLQDQLEVNVSDQAAADAIFFLVEHNLNTFEEIQRFVEEAQKNPDSVEVPQSLIDLVENLDLSQIQASLGL